MQHRHTQTLHPEYKSTKLVQWCYQHISPPALIAEHDSAGNSYSPMASEYYLHTLITFRQVSRMQDYHSQ